MVAACPKCRAKYRVDPESLGPEGGRMRCAKCQAVFRVRAPQAAVPTLPPAQVSPPAASNPQVAVPTVDTSRGTDQAGAPDDSAAHVDRERLVLVADPEVESGKMVIGALASWGLQPVLVHDGVEAMLTIQRMLPRVVILDAALPKMYGFQICEVMKRNESLRSIPVVLVGTVHHQDRYRRPPNELYGADVYLEKPDLVQSLPSTLARFGLSLSSGAAPSHGAVPAPPPAAPVTPSAVPASPPPAPVVAPSPTVATEPAAPVPASDGLDQKRADAERLARIIVSDIVLYHPERFEEGLASGRLAEVLDGPIAEGRGFFAQRVDPLVRDERDFLMEELVRVGQQRRAQ